MNCPNCGGLMCGDGYRTVYRCEDAEWEDYAYVAPDDPPVNCRSSYYGDEDESSQEVSN